MSVRLFVAVNFPGELRRELWRATAPLRESSLPVRWVSVDAVHLTLKFLGNADPAIVADLGRALDHAVAGARMFPLPMGGFGAFPTVERPNVIWVGCEGVPALELLQHRVEVETERLGFPVEGRPFRPHVTLGRARRDARPSDFRSLAGMLDRLEFQHDALVESVDLVQSRPGPDGSVYTVMHVARLAAQELE